MLNLLLASAQSFKFLLSEIKQNLEMKPSLGPEGLTSTGYPINSGRDEGSCNGHEKGKEKFERKSESSN
jgi:hypothetical protein